MLDNNTILTWHRDSLVKLFSAYKKDRLAHAILFTGDSGIGKKSVARFFANALLCNDFNHQLCLPCGVCQGCLLFAANTHTDLLYLSRHEDKKNISIDQVRVMIEQLGKTARIGAKRVVIVEQLENLTISAFNSMLKSLEEPGKDVFFILTSDSSADVPVTIKSRCIDITLYSPPADLSVNWLKQQGVDQQHIHLALERTHAAPLAAKHWIESGLLVLCEQFDQQLVQLSAGALTIDKLLKGIENEKRPMMINWMYEKVSRLITRMASDGDNQDRLVLCFQFLDRLLQQKSYTQRNSGANIALVLESILVSWIELTKDLDHSYR